MSKVYTFENTFFTILSFLLATIDRLNMNLLQSCGTIQSDLSIFIFKLFSTLLYSHKELTIEGKYDKASGPKNYTINISVGKMYTIKTW